jgi:SAM-dependent methyltransferase
MVTHLCRVCGRDFFPVPLLHYSNMPKAAQHFPDAGALPSEFGVDLEVCQCSGCGLVQLSNEPVPYFREVIRAAAVSNVIQQAKTKQFAEFLEKHGLHGKKLLEVGCGRGEFLSLLSPFDVQASGLEFSETAVAECRKHDLHVSQGYPDQALGRLADGPFDAFFLLMFLEHMPEPNLALRAIAENLADHAVGLVEVPNFDMVLKKRLFSEFIGDHLFYFTKDTLQSTLQINGFDVIACDELRDDYVLSATVRKRGGLDISHFHGDQERIRTELGAYLDRFPEKQVAVWGAGHQALAIIAMTGTAHRIRYVLDSAPFKQGRYTPATHIPIVPPDRLRSDPVEAVIIMAASYSDEVAGIIRQQFNPELSVAILRDFGLELVPQDGLAKKGLGKVPK